MPAGKKLTKNVHVPAGPEGSAKFFPSGSTPDKEYADQITNPRAWSDDDEYSESTSSSSASKSAASRSSS